MNPHLIIMQQQLIRARPPALHLPPPWFTFEQISAILGSPLANVEANWPLVATALLEYEADELTTVIAALATIGVEVSSFEPIEEYRNADGSIPPYWYSYGGGPLYHGRGFIQLTHDYNYAHYGAALGVDLVTNPSRALDPIIAARVLALYVVEHGIPSMAKAGQWVAVRKAVNGGTNGLARFLDLVDDFSVAAGLPGGAGLPF